MHTKTWRTVSLATEPLHVGQFGIVDHEPVDQGPNAGIFHGKGPAGERAELFVLAEGTTPAGEAFGPHVVSALGQLWMGLDMSVTGALRRCFDEAQRNVLDWNRKSIAQHRAAIGLTLLARKGDQAVIAQAGPTIAFHFSGERLTVYEPGEEHCQAFGGGQEPNPEFTRVDLRPGDRVLVLSTVALLDLDAALIRGILGLPGSQVLQDLYRRIQHLRNLTVLLVEVPAAAAPARPQPVREREPQTPTIIGSEDVDAPPADLHAHTGFQPSLFIETTNPALRSEVEAAREKLTHISERARAHASTGTAVSAVAAEMPPLRRAVGDTGALRQLAADQQLRASVSQASAMAAAGEGGGDRTPRPQQSSRPVNSAAASSASFSRSLVRQRSAQPPDRTSSDAQLASEMAASRRNQHPTLTHARFDDASSSASLAATTLVRPRTSMGGRWRASGSLARRSSVRSQAPSTRLVVFLGLALLIALVGAFTVPGMLGNSNEGRVEELISSAEQSLAAAQVQDNPADQRSALTAAKAMLLEAEQLGGTSTATQSLINQVAGAISQLDAITQPQRVELIADFSAFGDRPVTVVDISIGPGVGYLMDTTSGQVIAQPLDGSQPTVIYREDASAGQARPSALAFYRVAGAADGSGLLLIGDANGAIWSYAAGTLTRMPIAIPTGSQLTDIAVYNGDLYLLDGAAGRILRFTGAGGTFPYDPTVSAETSVLKTAVRFMVDDEIITSDGDGTLRRYAGDLTLVLSQAGVDEPLSAAAAPWVFEDGHIALADPANDRLVVFNRDGTFVRQYRSPEFATLTSLAMRDDAGFVFAGSKLLRITW